MGLRHQLAHTLQITFLQRACRFNGARIFAQYMANAFCDYRVQFAGNGIERLKADIAQGRLLEETGAGFALFTAGIILAAHQRALKVTVDDHHGDTFRHGNRFGAERTAINQQRMIFFAERRDELIHNAAVTADKLVLGLLSVERNLRAVQRQVIKLLEDGAHRHFQRGGGA